jgi:hypothetical protein
MSNVKDRQKHQAEVESRVKERSASSRENVKKLYTAAKRAEETDIAAGNDEKTHMFLQAKSDARAFATYVLCYTFFLFVIFVCLLSIYNRMSAFSGIT